MYKVKTNNDKKVYRVQDFTSGDNIEESKFVEGTNKKGAPQLQAQVCVLFKDEYTSLNQELESLKSEVQDLKTTLNDKEVQIQTLEKQIKESKRANMDEVMQLKEDNFNITQEHASETNKLHQEISNLEKSHLEDMKTIDNAHANEILKLTKAHQDEVLQLNEEKSQIIQEHLKEINEKEQSYNDEREQIRTSFLNLLTNVNTEDISEINEIQRDVPSLLKPFLRSHMRKLEDLKERKQANTPEKIIKTYELSGEKEKE